MYGVKKDGHRLAVEELNDRLCLSASALAAAPEPAAGICHGTTVLAWARVDGTSPVQDDVIVDGGIITGEDYDTATIATHGYIRIKKLNSGG